MGTYSGSVRSAIALAALVFGISGTVQAQGLTLPGVGASNRSMGGAGVAAAVDPAGALHWNPASITAFDKEETVLGLELLVPDIELSSSLPTGEQGSVNSDSGPAPIPTLATVFKTDPSSRLTFGVGVFGVAGFRSNYPASATSPISSPQAFGGLGRIAADAELFQLAPTAAYEFGNGLSLGIAPTLSMARLRLEPQVFAVPNADGTYPSQSGNQYTLGGGFQVGAYWEAGSGLAFGASVKSPQWFEDFEFNAVDENGLPRDTTIDFEYPLILSVGTSYKGIDNLTVALDVRYLDYANADIFEDTGFDENGALRGIGWNSIFGAALGADYTFDGGCSLRLGYSFYENPIDDRDAVFNVASPVILEHIISVGARIPLTRSVALSLAYLYAFENDIEGEIITPAGPIPGSSVRSELSAYAVGAALELSH